MGVARSVRQTGRKVIRAQQVTKALDYSYSLAGHQISIHERRSLDDAEWDDFLSRSGAQYQQSSLWAKAKSVDGWSPIRAMLEVDGQLAGGFQVLVRNSRWGKVGYVSKGPVGDSQDNTMSMPLAAAIVALARKRRIRALVVQPPDCGSIEYALMQHGLLPNHLVNVISATLLVDLAGTFDDVLSRMRRNTLALVRRARRRGVSIREGNESDVAAFFSMMQSTCARQQTSPQPATLAAMASLWRALSPKGLVRMSLAECEGRPVAGMVCIRFGDRVTAWKKGWSGEYADWCPNYLVTFDAIEWAHRAGARLFDFAGMNRQVAVAAIEGAIEERNLGAHRDCFNLGFGGRVKLLPESRLYIANPFVRLLYRAFCGARSVARSFREGVQSR